MDSSRDSSGVCSSSSNESVIDSESDIYTEESDEEGGVVLVPKTRTEPEPRPELRGSAPVLHSAPVPEEVLGNSQGHSAFFISCVKELRSKPIIQRSPRGRTVDKVLQFLEDRQDVSELAVSFLSCVYTCIISSERYKLPSRRVGMMWNSFHKLRNGSAVKHMWNSSMSKLQAPSCESELALQLLLDTAVRKMLRNKSNANMSSGATAEQADLTDREKNAVRYMAGYVAVTLLKRYKKDSKNDKIRLKRKFFVSVLKAMSAEHQPENVESVEDYSTLWSELIDRGGLYHISDQVYHFMLDVEEVVRTQLNIKNFSVRTSHSQDSNFSDSLIAQVIETESVLSKWEDIAHRIPHRFEKYSIELLKAVVRLWTTVRLHAFAKGWTMKFEKRYQKGTRKTLQTSLQDNA